MTNNDYKVLIIKHLVENGYTTYAEYFTDIDFYIATFHDGSYCPTAFMSPKDHCIVINPGFFKLQNPNDPKERENAFKQISVLIRHELLHFLLTHEKRFVAYLKKKYPDSWGRVYVNPTMHRIANFAMDYDLCNEGYSVEDKNIIRNLKVNGNLVGGLITEEQVKNDQTRIWFDDGTEETFTGSQFNNWEKTSMEDMWQMLSDAHQKYTTTAAEYEPNAPIPGIQPKHKVKQSEAYYKMYDKIFNKFKGNTKEAAELLGRLMAGETDIDIDTWKV